MNWLAFCTFLVSGGLTVLWRCLTIVCFWCFDLCLLGGVCRLLRSVVGFRWVSIGLCLCLCFGVVALVGICVSTGFVVVCVGCAA